MTSDEPVPAVFRGPDEQVGVATAFLLGPAPSAGRRAELAMTPCLDDPEINPLQVLARAADAWMREAPATVILGRIQPGTALELRFPPGDARA
jgi:hypothetical protein